MIVCDIDGVLADFDKAFDEYIRRFLPNLGQPLPYEYDFRKRYPDASYGKIGELFNQFAMDGGYYYLEPYVDIQKVSILNPTIITSRPEVATNDSYAWLIEHKIKFKNLIIAHDKSKFVPGTRLIFEDKGKNILPFADAGIPSYLFTQPYNHSVSHKNIIRVNSWSEIDIEKIARMLNI
jgi:uncharacterized HAD superfamily protein